MTARASRRRCRNEARNRWPRIATADDIAETVVLAATNPNLTGTIIEADGGARFVSIT